MNPNTQAYYRSGLKWRLPVTEVPQIEGFKLTLGKNHYYFTGSYTPCNNGTGLLMASSKYSTNVLLDLAHIPVPKGKVLDSSLFNYDTLIAITADLKYPLVVKPATWSSKGRDVFCNISNLVTLFELCDNLTKQYPCLFIEEFHGGLQSYRIHVFQNKILGIIARFPAHVIGNGENTIVTLVENENMERAAQSNIMAPIQLDFEAHTRLKYQNFTPESIPEKGKIVHLGYTCNLTRGGTIQILPLDMCKENKKLFLKVAKVLSLELVGIDVECKNLDEPIEDTGGVIIEANDNPSIRIFEDGIGGSIVNVTGPVMKSFIFKHPIRYLLHLCNDYTQLMSYILGFMLFFAIMLYTILYRIH